MSISIRERDPFDPRVSVRATGLLAEFNAALVLSAADVHVATRLAELADERDEAVVLACALAVRAPRLGHVHVDLATIRETASVDAEEQVDLSTLPWPEPRDWIARVASSSLVMPEDHDGLEPVPLQLVGSWLYLNRYWREERQVAEDLLALAADQPAVDGDALERSLRRLFGEQAGGRQAVAVASAALGRLTVVAGGPGTGKTTTVARIVALLAEQAKALGAPAPLVALAAPTGKAAARLQEAVHEEAAQLDVSGDVRAQLLDLRASTLHRLLGWRPGSHSRFRHHRGQRLPHDVVVVDETSMVSLSMMGRLVEAVRPGARLVLVGDPGQLASIEAGAVLGDVVGPAAVADPPAGPLGDRIVVLDRVHRFGGGIAELATAIRRGDADAVVSLLRSGRADVHWIEADVAGSGASVAPVRARAVDAARRAVAAARAGGAAEAIAALGSFRVLCAHRAGPDGVATWTARIEGWLAEEIDDLGVADRWYAGRPLLVTENDPELRLYNGDTGVVIAHDDRLVAAFERGGETVTYSPSRLGAVETVYAMTIHKSQGSQFDTTAVLLPSPSSRLLTRELLYTAATRARRQLLLAGSEDAIRSAVLRPIARASGLRSRLWTS